MSIFTIFSTFFRPQSNHEIQFKFNLFSVTLCDERAKNESSFYATAGIWLDNQEKAWTWVAWTPIRPDWIDTKSFTVSQRRVSQFENKNVSALLRRKILRWPQSANDVEAAFNCQIFRLPEQRRKIGVAYQ